MLNRKFVVESVGSGGGLLLAVLESHAFLGPFRVLNVGFYSISDLNLIGVGVGTTSTSTESSSRGLDVATVVFQALESTAARLLLLLLALNLGGVTLDLSGTCERSVNLACSDMKPEFVDEESKRTKTKVMECTQGKREKYKVCVCVSVNAS